MIAVPMGVNFSILETFNYIVRIINLRTYPVSVLMLTHGERSTAATERIYNKVTGLCGHCDDTIQKLCRKRISGTILRFEFRVPNRRYICPHVLYRDALW